MHVYLYLLFSRTHQHLCELEDAAKAAGKGKHGPNPGEHVRQIVWQIENPRKFIDCLWHKPVNAVIEHVINGSTLRVLIEPGVHETYAFRRYTYDWAVASMDEFFPITLMLAGIRVRNYMK